MAATIYLLLLSPVILLGGIVALVFGAYQFGNALGNQLLQWIRKS